MAAREAAWADADPGVVFWSDARGHCRAAVLLAPDRMLSAAELTELGLLALHDALATLAPPQVPLQLALPDGILVEGARAADVRTEQAPGAVPGWAIIAIDVAILGLGDDPGANPGETSLHEEGFGDVDAMGVLAQFCRHLLVWIDAWQEAGPGVFANAPARQRVAA